MENGYRRWLFTFNNPLQHGWTREHIIEQINKTKNIIYWCMGEEIGEENTSHIHLFLYHANQVRFETMQKRFYGAHIDIVNGSCIENRNYVFKEGQKFNKNPDTGEYKYTDSSGKIHTGTHYDNTNEEFGECPTDTQGTRNDLHNLYNLIKAGYSNFEILEYNPQYIDKLDKIDRARNTYLAEVKATDYREIDCCYIWGVTGSGKTRGVMDEYGYQNVHRVIDYKNPFDNYRNQDVVLFEEFRSGITMTEMLTLLDVYPCELRCRYSNKQALYDTVYFATNIDLRQQYPYLQQDEPETWKAFLRRIKRVKVYYDVGCYEVWETEYYLKNKYYYFGKSPFEDEEDSSTETKEEYNQEKLEL